MRAALLALSSALAFAIVAGRNPMSLSGPRGVLDGSISLSTAAVAALALLGWTAGTEWARLGRWSAIAIAAQALALQIVRAGRGVSYQHYLPPGEVFGDHRLAAGGLVLTAGIVGWGLWRERARLYRLIARCVGRGTLIVLALAFVATSATLSRDPRLYVAELVVATLVQGTILGAVILAVASLPGAPLSRSARAIDRVFGAARFDGAAEPGGIDVFAWLAAAAAAVAAAGLSWGVYQNHPHVPDEVAYLIHARYFAEGLLAMPLPPAPNATNIDLMTYGQTRWFSPVPPGWPAILALGVILGAPWLVNPVLTGANVLLGYVLLRELYDGRTARFATVLLALSPWQIFLGMSFMTHTATLTSALLAALAVARMRRGGGAAWGLLAGGAVGFVGLTRPLEGLAVTVLLGAWMMPVLARRQPLPFLSLLAGASPVSALALWYNRAMTGSATTFPIMAYIDKYYAPGANDLGFGPNRGLGWIGLDPLPGHGFADVLINLNLNLSVLNVELFGWGAGSFLLLLWFLFAGRKSRSDSYMLAVIATIVGIHSFYWFSGGPDFGARYWYLILVPCAALTARALVALEGVTHRAAGVRAIVAVAVLSLGTIAVFYPWRALDRYYHYRGMRPDIPELAAEYRFGRSVVLVRGKRHPDYASAAIYNPVELRDPDGPVYLWDRGPEARREALLAYPDRPIWLVDGPTRTGDAFRVVRGPLSASELLPGAGRP